MPEEVLVENYCYDYNYYYCLKTGGKLKIRYGEEKEEIGLLIVKYYE